jgi:hypothetical protein
MGGKEAVLEDVSALSIRSHDATARHVMRRCLGGLFRNPVLFTAFSYFYRKRHNVKRAALRHLR